MYSHVNLGVHDLLRASAFYDRVLRELDITRAFAGDGFVAYRGQDERGPLFFICLPFNGEPASAGNGVHVAFLAPNRAAVDRFHRVALEQGATNEGDPGVRPHYHPDYYGAYIRDLDGNKLQACHQTGESE